MKKNILLILFLLLIFGATDLHALNVSFNLQIGGPGREKGQFQTPTGITVAKDGTIYVVDSYNNRVQVFTPKGEFKSAFGAKGSGNGQLSYPYGIALTKDGKLFVADSGNNRIQAFDREGRFLYAFGKKGSSDAEISYPKGIAVDNNERVFVVDSGNRRIVVFTIDGIYLDSFGEKGEGKGQFYDPTGISVSNDGLLWVADTGNNRIQVFDAKGTFKMSVGSKGSDSGKFLEPAGIFVDPFGRVVVVDSGNGRIQILNSKGEVLSSLGSKGGGRAQFYDPQSVYTNGEGNCYIVDSGNNRVQVFSFEKETGKPLAMAPPFGRLSLKAFVGLMASDVAASSTGNLYILDKQDSKITILDKNYKPIGSFGKYGKGKGMFSSPSSIVMGDNDNIFVSDTGNHRIQVFDRDGKYLYEFGGKGSTDGKLYSPGGLAYKMGKLWVADTGNYRIQIFNSDGIFLGKFGKKGGNPGEFSQPVDVAVDSKGSVYVTDYDNNWVQVLTGSGKSIRVIGKEGTGKGEFLGPKSIVVDDDDRLFILESEKGMFGGGNNRVQVFNAKGEFLFKFGAYGKDKGEINLAEGLSYANGEEVSLFISDTGNSRVQVIELKDVPSSLKDVRIEGYEGGAGFSWQEAQESFIKGYRIYASSDQSGYHQEAEVPADENSFELRHRPDAPYYYYGVAAVGKGGLEGPMTMLPDTFRMGYEKYLAKKYDEAISRFTELLKQDPNNGRASYYMGLSNLAIGSTETIWKAKDIFTKLAAVKGFEGGARLNLGKIALLQKKFGDAESQLNKAIAAEPGITEVYFLLGKAYFEQEFYQKSLENLLKAEDLDPGDPAILEMLGRIYHKSKAYEKAISSFEKGLSIDPSNYAFHKELGETYLAMRELKKAREEFRIFLEKVPDDVAVRLGLAETALALKDGQEAFEHVNIALAKEKDNPNAHIIKGKALLLLGKKEDALLAFNRAIEADPKNNEAHYMVAFAYRDLGLNSEAIEQLRKLFDINKAHEGGHLLMAELLIAAGNKEKAVEEYRTVQRINPQNPFPYFPLGKLLYERKDYEGARKELETAVKYDPRNKEAYLLLGGTLKAAGRSGEAINAYQAALEINKNEAIARQELGRIYMENGILDKAIAELKTAQALAPRNSEVYGLLGQALIKRLRFDEAIDAFAMAVKIDPQETAKKELNDAYEAKKRFLEVKQNVPVIEIRDANIQKVFASLYKYYNSNPIGEIKIANNSDDSFSSVKVSLKVMNYMDFPTDREVKDLKPRAIETVPLFALFNNKILDIVEDTPAQAEVEISYYREKKEEKNKLTIPFTIYNRNAITWDNPSMMGAFVTPKDEPIKEFARSLAQQYPETSALLNKQMATAMLIFDALGAYGTVYSPDPNNPYEKVSLGGGAIDSLQYPRETLKLKTGDCDDLSTLIAALLENLGIETAFIETPGHLHMMFGLDIDPKKADTISLNPEQYVILGNKVWIPVEATAVGSSFSEAWYKGSDIYYRWKKENKAEITKVHEAWGRYQPATLSPATWSPVLPAKEKIDAILSMEVNLQKGKKIADLLKPYQAALEKNPKDTNARMQLGMIYAENGLLAEAMKEFSDIIGLEAGNPDAYTNLGNTYLLAKKYDNAIEMYKKAEGIASKDVEIKVNLAIAYYRKGMIKEAQKKFTEAAEISPGVRDERSFLNSMLFK